MMELRKVTASLVTEFDIDFAKGEIGEAVFDEQIESFTLSPGPLRLKFEKRSCGDEH